MIDDVVVCPKCKLDVIVCNEWGFWYFMCSKCDWVSKPFSRYKWHPDEITQEEVSK